MPSYSYDTPGTIGYYEIKGTAAVLTTMTLADPERNTAGWFKDGVQFKGVTDENPDEYGRHYWIKVIELYHAKGDNTNYEYNRYCITGPTTHYVNNYVFMGQPSLIKIGAEAIEAKKEEIESLGYTFANLTPLELEAIEPAQELYESYTPFKSAEAYANDLDGLRISDLRGIIGMPNQFLPLTDPRIIDADSSGVGVGSDNELGRLYTERIITNIPLLLMTPGLPTFMSGYKDSEKATVIGRLMDTASRKDEGFIEQAYNDLVGAETGKYYTLKFAYTDYFLYVNAMLRSAAYFLGIEEEKIGSGNNAKKLKDYNWFYHTTSDGSSKYDAFKLSNYLGPYAGAIPFYADVGNTTDDSFSNSTTASGLSSIINGLSDQGRELNFLIGNIGGISGVQLDKLTGMESLSSNITEVQDQLKKLLPGGNILSKIVGNAQTILAGGRMIFPEIWGDSNFSRSYSVKMKLAANSGNPLDIYMHILVPIYFLLGFVLPRQSTGQAYMSPFLVRAYSKSLFNVDMGIITGLSITKGSEGEWTQDGLPTVAEISFEIKDLYNGMYMSTYQDRGDLNMFRNVTELDYIANTCGININEPDLIRTLRMYLNMNLVKKVDDAITIGFLGNISQHFNQKFQNIFGKF